MKQTTTHTYSHGQARVPGEIPHIQALAAQGSTQKGPNQYLNWCTCRSVSEAGGRSRTFNSFLLSFSLFNPTDQHFHRQSLQTLHSWCV